MKIISWNVMQLGGFEKQKEVHKSVAGKNMSILCTIETKFSIFYDYLCAPIYGTLSHGYSFHTSVGAPGGLL